MIILMGMIAFHLLTIFSARYFKKLSAGAISVIIILSVCITAWILFGMYTMEKPDTTDQFY